MRGSIDTFCLRRALRKVLKYVHTIHVSQTARCSVSHVWTRLESVCGGEFHEQNIMQHDKYDTWHSSKSCENNLKITLKVRELRNRVSSKIPSLLAYIEKRCNRNRSHCCCCSLLLLCIANVASMRPSSQRCLRWPAHTQASLRVVLTPLFVLLYAMVQRTPLPSAPALHPNFSPTNYDYHNRPALSFASCATSTSLSLCNAVPGLSITSSSARWLLW